jgi:hypothetical protein
MQLDQGIDGSQQEDCCWIHDSSDENDLLHEQLSGRWLDDDNDQVDSKLEWHRRYVFAIHYSHVGQGVNLTFMLEKIYFQLNLSLKLLTSSLETFQV